MLNPMPTNNQMNDKALPASSARHRHSGLVLQSCACHLDWSPLNLRERYAGQGGKIPKGGSGYQWCYQKKMQKARCEWKPDEGKSPLTNRQTASDSYSFLKETGGPCSTVRLRDR